MSRGVASGNSSSAFTAGALCLIGSLLGATVVGVAIGGTGIIFGAGVILAGLATGTGGGVCGSGLRGAQTSSQTSAEGMDNCSPCSELRSKAKCCPKPTRVSPPNILRAVRRDTAGSSKIFLNQAPGMSTADISA